MLSVMTPCESSFPVTGSLRFSNALKMSFLSVGFALRWLTRSLQNVRMKWTFSSCNLLVSHIIEVYHCGLFDLR